MKSKEKLKMKLRFLCVLFGTLLAAALWAVPPFTPLIDGIQDAGWGNTPDHATQTVYTPLELNLDGGMYVTNDAAYLYMAFPADNDPWDNGENVDTHVLIDVGSTATGGTTDPYGASGVVYAQPFLPDYDIILQYSTGSGQVAGWCGFMNWTGSGWNYGGLDAADYEGGGNMWTEIRVPFASLGGPTVGTVINLAMYIRPSDPSKPCASTCLPADATFPGDDGNSCNGSFESQFAYTIQEITGDFDPPGVLGYHQIDRGSVEIMFDEAMNQTTLNNVGNYTPTGFVCTGIRYTTPTAVALWASGFTDNNPYAVLVLPAVQDASGNAIDPTDNQVSWNAVDYSTVTVTAIDQTSTHDQLLFKGSFNFYHEYDASWTGGSQAMFDDGTHGDPVANDHQFTLRWPLVPNGGTPNFEWGLIDENNNWLIVGPNQSFSLPDPTDIAVNYTVTIPDNETSQDVTVTFRCDMQFITDPIDFVAIAGYFNNWPAPGSPMTDPDADGVWTFEHLFPAGSNVNQEFKFQRIVGGGTNWEGIGNRAFQIDDSGPTQDLGNMFFNNYLPAPYDVTAYRSGNDVEIRWNSDYERVSFQVYGHTSPDSVIQQGTLVGTTTGSSLLDTDISGVKKFYQVRTIAP
jgi:hypothetical protein